MGYSSVTLNQFLDEAWSRVNNRQFYNDDELIRYINEGLCMWQLMTGYWRDSVDIKTEGGRIWYDVSPYLLKVLRVEYNGTPLMKDNVFSMDWCKGLWEFGQASAPTRWFPMSLNYIGINPSAGGGETLTLTGLSHAPTFTTHNDTVNINRWIVDPILDYVQHIASIKSGGNELTATTRLYRSFVDAAAKQNNKMRLTSIYRKTLGEDLDGQQQPNNRSTARRTR